MIKHIGKAVGKHLSHSLVYMVYLLHTQDMLRNASCRNILCLSLNVRSQNKVSTTVYTFAIVISHAYIRLCGGGVLRSTYTRPLSDHRSLDVTPVLV